MAIPFQFEEDRCIEVVVSDFDGTVTVPAEGAEEAFTAAHAEGFAELHGREAAWAIDAYVSARNRIKAAPDEYGWEIGGRIVAPALVDAFMAAQVSAQVVLRDLGEDLDAWRDRLDGLYQAHYLKYSTEFRPEMLRTFLALEELNLPVHVVSNSDGAKVQKRMEVLGDEAAALRSRVRGGARKFIVTDDGPNCLLRHTSFSGLRRQVYLRKQHYFDVLRSVMDETRNGMTWDRLLVIGDMAELDLVMPVEMGAYGLLVWGPNTPAYEIKWAEQHPRVQVIKTLDEVLTTLGL